MQKRHATADVLAFSKTIDQSVPRSQDIHVVLDNLSAHKAPEITDWLAHPRRARWHLHFTPTSSSWLNLVERWFKELTDRRLRRGVFTSVPNLIDAITTWAAARNEDPKPFVLARRSSRNSGESDPRTKDPLTSQINDGPVEPGYEGKYAAGEGVLPSARDHGMIISGLRQPRS